MCVCVCRYPTPLLTLSRNCFSGLAPLTAPAADPSSETCTPGLTLASGKSKHEDQYGAWGHLLCSQGWGPGAVSSGPTLLSGPLPEAPDLAVQLRPPDVQTHPRCELGRLPPPCPAPLLRDRVGDWCWCCVPHHLGPSEEARSQQHYLGLRPGPQFTVVPITSVPWKLLLLLTDLYFFLLRSFKK